MQPSLSVCKSDKSVHISTVTNDCPGSSDTFHSTVKSLASSPDNGDSALVKTIFWKWIKVR